MKPGSFIEGSSLLCGELQQTIDPSARYRCISTYNTTQGAKVGLIADKPDFVIFDFAFPDGCGTD